MSMQEDQSREGGREGLTDSQTGQNL